jgi:hypothetical protein
MMRFASSVFNFCCPHQLDFFFSPAIAPRLVW